LLSDYLALHSLSSSLTLTLAYWLHPAPWHLLAPSHHPYQWLPGPLVGTGLLDPWPLTSFLAPRLLSDTLATPYTRFLAPGHHSSLLAARLPGTCWLPRTIPINDFLAPCWCRPTGSLALASILAPWPFTHCLTPWHHARLLALEPHWPTGSTGSLTPAGSLTPHWPMGSPGSLAFAGSFTPHWPTGFPGSLAPADSLAPCPLLTSWPHGTRRLPHTMLPWHLLATSHHAPLSHAGFLATLVISGWLPSPRPLAELVPLASLTTMAMLASWIPWTSLASWICRSLGSWAKWLGFREDAMS